MALKGASTTTDSDWINWEALAAENAAVVCTVKELEPEVDFGNGSVAPVRARVIVLTGSQAGTVYPNERILKAGIRIKLTEVGDDVVGRLAVYGKRNHVGLNNEQDGDLDLAKAALAERSGGDVPAQRSSGKAAAKAETAPADDEDPPF